MIYDYPYHRNYFNKYNMYYKNNYLNNYDDKNNILKENTDLNNDDINTTEKKETEFRKQSDDTIINILGIKLALDDLIILGLLFILYMEEVKDISLYIVLILLLLS